jgi:Plasmid pRiA4b ORF-3-like protein
MLCVYQFEVVLPGISPMIWRRLLLRSDHSIADLHYTIQIANTRAWVSAEPAHKTKVFRLLMKISVAMSALNLRGMGVMSFDPLSITGQAGWLLNSELLGQVSDHHARYGSRLRKERSQKTDCTQLNGGFYIAGSWLLPDRKRVIPYSIQRLKRLRPALFRQNLIALLSSLNSRRSSPSSRIDFLLSRHDTLTSCSGREALQARSSSCATGHRLNQERRMALRAAADAEHWTARSWTIDGLFMSYSKPQQPEQLDRNWIRTRIFQPQT